MKSIYKDDNLEIFIPESFEDNQLIPHNWCTNLKSQYEYYTVKLKQTLFRIVYNDGYILSIGVNKNDLKNGHWIDNVLDEKNKPTFIELIYLNNDIFNFERIKEIAIKHNNSNLLNMSNKIFELSDDIKNKIFMYLKNN